jgi:hypothetical protein
LTVSQDLIQAIAREVIARIEERARLSPSSAPEPAGDAGVFETVDEAVRAAAAAQRQRSGASPP